MSRSTSLFLVAAFLLFLQSTALAQQKQLDLSDVFTQQFFLSDTNSDSLTDAINGRIIIPDQPTESQVIAAANIAARLGFETTAMDLDVVKFESEVTGSEGGFSIVIGSEQSTEGLAPGQGKIALINAEDIKGIRVTGYDASGLLAAAAYLSGRYPLVGNSTPDLDALKEKAYKTLGADSTGVEDIMLQSLTVSTGKEGLTRVALAVSGAGAYFEEGFSLTSEKKKTWTSELTGPDVFRVQLTFSGASTILLQADKGQESISESSGGQGASAFFDLSDLYTINGIYTDTNKDKVPDDSRGYIAYSGTEAPKEVINLAARIGLETAGLKLPIVFPANQSGTLDQEGFPLLIGLESNVQAILNTADVTFTEADNGIIEIKKELLGEDANGLLITGKSEQELQSALSYATKNLPYVWDYGKGNVTLEEVQTEARRFFQGVTGEGQVANGIEKIDTWLSRLEGKDLENIEVKLATKESPEGLDQYLTRYIEERSPDAQVEVETYKTGFGVGEEIFTEEITIPWEVDEFWDEFDQDVLPNLGEESSGSILVRVSESPEMRGNIKSQIIEKLSDKGINPDRYTVHVLNAYKQGFSWMENVVIPELKDKGVDSVHIQYKHLRDSEEIKWQATAAKTRWLQEIYPIDGVLEQELGLSLSNLEFTPSYDPEHTYVFEAFDENGSSLYKNTFDPIYVVRPYFDLFPEYDSVRVSTGWLTVESEGEVIADQRIKTDLERFWDHMQTSTYAKVLDYVMDIQAGKPDPDLAPYFDELRFDVTLSEPNRQLGILKEQISPLEALHEDIYFETILFFNLIGNRYGVGRLSYPGRILPFMMPPEEGKPGKAKISFTGKQEGRPQVVLRYQEAGSETKEFYYELPNIEVDEPALTGIEVGESTQIANLIFDIEVDKEENPFQELKSRGSESYIDDTFLSAERLSGMIDAINGLREQGIFESSLSFSAVEKMTFRFTLEDSTEWMAQNTIRRTDNPKPVVRKAPLDEDFEYTGQNLVQWETPIPPEENDEILSRLNTFDNINVYYTATSLLGVDVYAMDLQPPVEAEFTSQAKLNALKPTLFISGRQHANEFSSTSHMLKLAEKIATESEYGKFLNKVNLVLHTVTNPDGANLAVELHNINPTHMHHAGYLGPLGVDITRDQDEIDPRYEVAKVRREIHDTWLPDVYINMHGYPPHEWVQYFAGYSAWMMSRERGPRSNNYWIPRGYFLTGFSWYDHDDFPTNKELSFALLDSISSRVDAVPAMREVNLEMQARYKKYRSHEDAYGEFYRNDIWVNAPLKGREQTGSGYRDPNITYFTLTSEAPDEPARGDWMQMNAAAGVAHSTGALQYLYHGKFELKNEVKTEGNRTHRSTYRVKPVLPESLFEAQKEDK